MAVSADHNRLILIAARQVLAPLGLRQKGRSRLWLDDHGWWLIAVEFQPSSWSRGTYLNVGAMWLWLATDHIAYEIGGRLEGFTEARDEAQFAAELERVVTRAAAEVARLRRELDGLASVARALGAKPNAGGYELIHAGIAAALAGQTAKADELLKRLPMPAPDAPEWMGALWEEAGKIRRLLRDPAALRARLGAAVRESRQALRLSSWDGALLPSSVPAA